MPSKWDYTQGGVFQGFAQVWGETKDPKYLDYIKTSLDPLIDENGAIQSYKPTDYKLDDPNCDKALYNRGDSYAYYLSEPVVTNDNKAVGALILASAKMESLPKH